MADDTGSFVRNWWDGLDRGRRIGFAAGAVTIVVVAALLAWFLLRPQFVPLTGDLSNEDTASLSAQLEEIRAPYRVDTSTGALLVRATDVDSIRAQLAKKGWPFKSEPGFELFDNGDFGMTEFTEHINYQRALQGELARTIMAMNSIRYARVQLVLPRSTLFKRSSESPKASILLVTQNDRPLNASQIAGIQQMVSDAVPNLKPADVSILNHDGVALTSAQGGSELSPSAMDSQIQAQADVENYLSAKAQDILTRLFPHGNPTVSVDVELQRSHISSTREEALPTGEGSGTISSIRSATPPKVKGMPVAEVDQGSSTAKASTSSPQFDVEYRVGHLTEQSESEPGAIKRMSVGVVIPDPSAEGLSVDDVKNLIATGIGIDPERGDRIAVYVVAGRGAGRTAANLDVPSSSAVVRPKHSQHHGVGPVWRLTASKPLWTAILVICVLLLLTGLTLSVMRRRQEGDLTAIEREELLRKVREWLKQ